MVLGQIDIPSAEDLEAYPLPPALGQNQQWWPEFEQPSTTSRKSKQVH